MDVDGADVLVLFTVKPTRATKRGGRHVEFGIAYALGKTLVVCGPRENIFHYMDGVQQFDDFDAVKGFLVSERDKRRGD